MAKFDYGGEGVCMWWLQNRKAKWRREEKVGDRKKSNCNLRLSLFQTFWHPYFEIKFKKEKIWLRTKRRSLQSSPTPIPTWFFSLLLSLFPLLFGSVIHGFCLVFFFFFFAWSFLNCRKRKTPSSDLRTCLSPHCPSPSLLE